MGKTSLATYVLVGVMVGAAVTSQGTGLVSEFLYHGFLAAMVGGLADWFGTVALFRKPLGISYKTAILARNRDRIVNEIMKFVGNDLLNVENIKKIVDKQNLLLMFLEYLDHRDGKKKLKEASYVLIYEMTNAFDSRKFSEIIKNALMEGKKEYGLLFFLEDILRYITSEENFDRFFNALIDAVKKILKDNPVQSMVQNHIDAFFEEYSQKSGLRRFYLNDKKRIEYIEEIFKVAWIKCDEMKDKENPDRLQIKDWLSKNICGFVQDGNVLSYMGRIENEKFKNNPEIMNWLSRKMDSLKNEDEILKLWEYINIQIERGIKKVRENEELLEMIDFWLKKQLYSQIEKNADSILNMAKSKLDSYSEAEFVSMVESKVADDLQMIRINGSFVGGLAGMLLYGIFCIAEGLFSI